MILTIVFIANAQTLTIKKGWDLLGSSEVIDNMAVFDADCVSVVWVYENDNWKAFSNDDANYDSLVNNLGIDNLISIISNERGFWVYGKNTCSIDTKSDAMSDKFISSDLQGSYIATFKDTGVNCTSQITFDAKVLVEHNKISILHFLGLTSSADYLAGGFNGVFIHDEATMNWTLSLNENNMLSGDYYDNDGCTGDISSLKYVDNSTNNLLTYNSSFKKYNAFLDLLPSNAENPANNIYSKDDWVINQKDNTDFYFGEFGSFSQLLSYNEANSYCSDVTAGNLNWRLPTNNEALVIAELHPIDAFIWTLNTTDTVFSVSHDSVNLKEKFTCQAQFFYDTNTQEGLWQKYCNETLTGKYAMCVADKE